MKKVDFKKVFMALSIALTFLFLGVERASAQTYNPQEAAASLLQEVQSLNDELNILAKTDPVQYDVKSRKRDLLLAIAKDIKHGLDVIPAIDKNLNALALGSSAQGASASETVSAAQNQTGITKTELANLRNEILIIIN